jgi:hypothetical protein
MIRMNFDRGVMFAGQDFEEPSNRGAKRKHGSQQTDYPVRNHACNQ